MNAPLYQFRWDVPSAGFEIVKTSWTDTRLQARAKINLDRGQADVTARAYGDQPLLEKPDRFLVERIDFSNTKRRSYYPLHSHTGLFREFANLHPLTDARALDFANRFGWLGHDACQHQVQRNEVEPGPGQTVSLPIVPWMRWRLGELLSQWKIEAERMNHLVCLWDAVKSEDHDTLSQFITWGVSETGSFTSVSYRSATDTFSLVGSQGFRPELFEEFMRGDIIEPARHALQTKINQALQEHRIHSRLLWDQKHEKPHLHSIPESLLGALWLQFAQAWEGGKEYRQCEQCRDWFEVGAQVREDAKFCKQACRFKHYRERQKEARRLNKEGMSPRDIARELDTTASTVRGWLKGQKR